MRKRLNLGLVVIIAGAITFFSLTPGGGQYGGTSAVTELYHAVAYFALAAALLLYFHDTTKGHVEAVMVAVLFGTGIELTQAFLPSRFFSLADIAMNTMGASVIFLDHRSRIVTHVINTEERLLERFMP